MRKLLGKFVLVTSNTPLGATAYSVVAHYIDRWVFRLSGGKTTFSAYTTGLPIVMLTVKGRKSGQARTVPLVAIPHQASDESFLLVASNWGQKHYPAWYYNLKAAGEATCTLGNNTQQYTAHELEGETYNAVWDHIVAFLPNYALYKRKIGTVRHIPVFAMSPKPSE